MKRHHQDFKLHFKFLINLGGRNYCGQDNNHGRDTILDVWHAYRFHLFNQFLLHLQTILDRLYKGHRVRWIGFLQNIQIIQQPEAKITKHPFKLFFWLIMFACPPIIPPCILSVTCNDNFSTCQWTLIKLCIHADIRNWQGI